MVILWERRLYLTPALTQNDQAYHEDNADAHFLECNDCFIKCTITASLLEKYLAMQILKNFCIPLYVNMNMILD